MLTVTKEFEARWTNYGDPEPRRHTFKVGEQYTVLAEKPEGLEVRGENLPFFFLFGKYLENCVIE